jgi:hypothetical protein
MKYTDENKKYVSIGLLRKHFSTLRNAFLTELKIKQGANTTVAHNIKAISLFDNVEIISFIFFPRRRRRPNISLNLYFRARRAWRILCVWSEATAQNVTKKISG